MNLWILAAGVMAIALIPCAVVCLRGGIAGRLAGLEAASVVATLILLLLAEGYGRQPFTDLALALAVLSFAGGMVFVRFLERWM